MRLTAVCVTLSVGMPSLPKPLTTSVTCSNAASRSKMLPGTWLSGSSLTANASSGQSSSLRAVAISRSSIPGGIPANIATADRSTRAPPSMHSITRSGGGDFHFDPAAAADRSRGAQPCSDGRGHSVDNRQEAFDNEVNGGASMLWVPPSSTNRHSRSARTRGINTVCNTEPVDPAVPTAKLHSPTTTRPGRNTI